MPASVMVPPRREQALAYIVGRIVRDGISPTNQEIGDALGVNKTRAGDLVKELIDRNVLRRTPGAQRGLQILDLGHAREIVVERLRDLGMIVVDARYENPPPCPQEHLPILSPFEHLPSDG